MRTPLVLTLVGASLLLGGRVHADPVSAGDYITLRLDLNDGTPIERFDDGGPFRFDLAGTANDFLTFCLELDEYFVPGETLRVGNISTAAQNGGVNTNYGDPISGTTAFLYTQFRAGNAAYSNGSLLQQAIWHLEGERAGSAAVVNFINQTQAEMATLGWGILDLGNVRVANLYRGANYQTRAQDMLILVPEPATALLMGVGLLIVTRGRRRLEA